MTWQQATFLQSQDAKLECKCLQTMSGRTERWTKIDSLLALLSCHTYPRLPTPKLLVAGDKALHGRATVAAFSYLQPNIPPTRSPLTLLSDPDI